MSPLSEIVSWLILAAVAYAVFQHIKKKRAEAAQEGHALMLAAVTLDAVVKQPTKAKMIAVMQHYVLDFGQRAAQTADPNICKTLS